jgi:hypothetical protein
LVNLSQFTKPWGCEVADLRRWMNQHPGGHSQPAPTSAPSTGCLL